MSQKVARAWHEVEAYRPVYSSSLKGGDEGGQQKRHDPDKYHIYFTNTGKMGWGWRWDMGAQLQASAAHSPH